MATTSFSAMPSAVVSVCGRPSRAEPMAGLYRQVRPPLHRPSGRGGLDKVDIIISGYGTNLIAPLMPIAMDRKLMLIGMFGLANNEKYKYPNYFQIAPNGPDPETATAAGFFELAAAQNPRPQTVAIVGADAEYPQHALVGA